MPIKRHGVVLSEPRGGLGGRQRNLLLGGPGAPRENFEIGVLKSAFQCILSNHGFVLLLKKSNFTEKNIHVMDCVS